MEFSKFLVKKSGHHLLMSVHAFSRHLVFNLLQAWRLSVTPSVCLWRWQIVVIAYNATKTEIGTGQDRSVSRPAIGPNLLARGSCPTDHSNLWSWYLLRKTSGIGKYVKFCTSAACISRLACRNISACAELFVLHVHSEHSRLKLLSRSIFNLIMSTTTK